MTCTYHAAAPQSEQGQFIWTVFKDEAWRVRVAGMGIVIGVELDTARRRCAAAGIDQSIADDLLSACEKGAVAAWNEKDETDGVGEN